MHLKQLFCAAISALITSAVLANGPVVVYSHRHYEVDQKLLDRFTQETGIAVNVVKAGANELIERLKNEGERTDADLFITADAGRLGAAKQAGLLQPVDSETLLKRVPSPFRDPEQTWFGFTKRARVIVYAPERVNPSELSTYEDLADDKWKGRILVRSSANIYNQSLMASLIAAHDKETALAWARAVRKNMARPPQGSDRDQIRAVAAGLGDVALVNTYYVGLLKNSPDPDDRAVANSVKIFFPNQDGRGTHVNVSGAGVVKHADQKEAAVKLLEFLVSDDVQEAYARETYEYPVVEDVERSDLQKSWGEFNEDNLNLGMLGDLNKQAVLLFNMADWN